MAERKLIRAFLSVLCLFGVFVSRSGAGEGGAAGGVLKAGVFVQPPFVMERKGGGYEGMAIELWEAAAAGLGVRTEYAAFDSVGELLEAVAAGEVDVAVSDLTVSHERAKMVKFSFPWYDAGMRIMVNKPATSFWSEMYRSRRFQVYLLFFVILALLALLMTWLRRKRDPDFPEDMKTGYTLSLLDVTSSVRSGEIEQEYMGWAGHVLSAVWMLFGVAMVAYVTSSMTTAMTTVHLDKDGIYELGDLPGKKVGALRGGVTVEYLRSLHLDVVPCSGLADAAEKLGAGRVRAVVSDAPALEYWAATHPGDGVEVVGELFHPDKYAFAGNAGHARIIDRVSVELIRMRESGDIDRLRAKYFGDAASR